MLRQHKKKEIQTTDNQWFGFFVSSGFGKNFLTNPSVQPRLFSSELLKKIFFSFKKKNL